MWQYNAMIALDLARERAREAQEAARRGRLVRDAAADGLLVPSEASRVRGAIAAPVRAFSHLTHAVSEAACTAATRIEGRTA